MIWTPIKWGIFAPYSIIGVRSSRFICHPLDSSRIFRFPAIWGALRPLRDRRRGFGSAMKCEGAGNKNMVQRPTRPLTEDGVPMNDQQQPIIGSLPAAQGLYDPANEHDACGVGFVAHIKGKKSHAIVAAGPEDPREPRPSRRGRRRPADGRRRRHPDPDPGRASTARRWRSRASTLPPPGEYGVGMIFLPKEHASRLACEQELERAVKAEGQVAARLARRAGRPRRCRCRRPCEARSRCSARSSSAAATDVIVHRRARAQALRDPQDRRAPHPGAQAQAQQGVLRAAHVGRTVVYKGLLLADQVGEYYRDLQDARVRLGARAGAPALLDQHLPRRGRWRTRTA